MRPSELPPGAPHDAQMGWMLGQALAWQVTAAEVALAAPILAWRTGLALAGGWVAPEAQARPMPAAPTGPAPEPEPAAAAAVAEEVDHLA